MAEFLHRGRCRGRKEFYFSASHRFGLLAREKWHLVGAGDLSIIRRYLYRTAPQYRRYRDTLYSPATGEIVEVRQNMPTDFSQYRGLIGADIKNL